MPLPAFTTSLLTITLLLPLALPGTATAQEAESAGGAPRQSILQRQALPAGAEMVATRLHVPPGGSAPAHHHAGTLFVYMLSGHVRSGMNDAEPVLYGPGDNWMEPEGTRHSFFENASQTEAAELLAVFVAPANATLTIMDK
jgi:quercetin dioxygenase-like cupin family protein